MGFFDKWAELHLTSKLEKKNRILEAENAKKLRELKLKETIKKNKDLKLEQGILFNRLKQHDKLSVQRLKTWYIDKYHTEKSFLINMFLKNGQRLSFITKTKRGSFNWNDGEYIIDESLKYYDVNARMYALDYHEDISIPFSFKINPNTVKELIESKGITDVDAAINPSTLRRFIVSEVIQKVLKGAELDEVFKFLKIMVTVCAILSFIAVMLLLRAGGFFSKIPGVS